MNTPRILLIAAAIVGLGGTFTQASAQEQPASVGIVHGTVDGHSYRNGGIDKEQVADMARNLKAYDLQLSLSGGKHNADATGVKVTITGAMGQKVFSLDDAGPLTDVDLPAGHYHVIADFGRVKRLGSVDVEKGELATLHLHGPNDPT